MSAPTILVAVDIIEDQVVRLTKGQIQEKTVYGDDPVEVALSWEKQGAEWLHVVDLDGATRGEAQNSKAVEEILRSVSIPVQVGGGVRTLESIESWLRAGAARVVIGTKSLDPQFLTEAASRFGQSLVVAVDARHGRVRYGGWLQTSETSAVDAARRAAQAGVHRIMFTDIERDGTLMGPNVEMVEEILDVVAIPVIASGGVTTDHDIRMLKKLVPMGLEGIIIGKALYSGALSLDAARLAAGAG